MTSHPHRVAVTGMGVCTPIGRSLESFRANLLAGVSGAGPITVFDPAQLPTRIAAEVHVAAEECAYRDRKIVFALDAARQAMAAAESPGTAPQGTAALSLGIGLELFSMEDMLRYRRPDFALPDTLGERLSFLQTPADLCTHLICRQHGLVRPPQIHISACAAGADAVGSAFRMVASGRCRWALAGGTDSMINPVALAGFCLLHATTRRNDQPERASRPFERTRDGFLLGEGAALLVLERLADARARGAHVHAEVVGYGNSFDAHNITQPHPQGRGALQSMRRALAEAGIGPDQVDCVNAHGTSTPRNDPVETYAIKQLLGERAPRVPVCAPKSMLGHLIAAAGAAEAVATIVCLEQQRVHPTINLEEPDPACDLDYVANVAREHPQRYALSNSFGFGGQNASLVFRRYRGGSDGA